ncbi:MAG: hypothetical protein ACO1N0_10475 [Fluviicola sp.]
MDLLEKKSQDEPDIPTNSFEKRYKKNNPGLRYSYHEKKQTHNYSYNWDFDGDGKKDELLFVGNKGAHLQYHLRVGLSSEGEGIICILPTVESDFPFLPSERELSKKGFDPIKSHEFFAVGDFNKDSLMDIFLKIEKSPYATPKDSVERKNQVVNYLSISFKGAKPRVRNFEKLNDPEN